MTVFKVGVLALTKKCNGHKNVQVGSRSADPDPDL